MPVCNFFIQGRCRYGDKCWNEHPRGSGGGGGGGGGGFNNSYSRSSAQQQPRGGHGGGGGFGHRVWVNPTQQKGAYIQPSSFSSHGNDDWGQGEGLADWGRGGGGGGGKAGAGGRGGGGRRDHVKSDEFSFSAQNRFSALSTHSTFDKGGRGAGHRWAAGDEDDDKKLEIIQLDIESWESSGQWVFSCYSGFKTSLSGFTELSPEELRLEYYNTRASGDLQGYVNAINQLLNQWRSRIQELKVMNPATRTAVLAELNNPVPQSSSSGFGAVTAAGFGSSTSGFESKGFGAPVPAEASTFSFAAQNDGFDSSSAPSPGFGGASAASAQPPSGFGFSSAPTQPASDIGSSSTPAASSFSFSGTTGSTPAATSGFGSASGFSFNSTAGSTGGGFSSAFEAKTPGAAGSSSTFRQASGGFGAPAGPAVVPETRSAPVALDSLFSSEASLTPEELNQFKAKKFTIGQIPLKPPPADMLMV